MLYASMMKRDPDGNKSLFDFSDLSLVEALRYIPVIMLPLKYNLEYAVSF